MKKLLSILCSISLLLGYIPAYAFTPHIVVNEAFDNIATNGTPENVMVKNGMDARVVTKNNNDKALYAKADGCVVNISVPIEKTYSKMVFSFDVMLKGDKVKGKAMTLNGSAATNMLSYSLNGAISLEDSMTIGGYTDGKWKTYAAAIDFDKGCYDLYVNGVRRLKNRRFYKAPTEPTSMDFKFSCGDEDGVAEVYMDNIRIYEGKEILDERIFPKKGINTQTLEFTPAQRQEAVYDNVFINIDTEKSVPSMSFVEKDGTVANWASIKEGGTQYMHFAKTSSNDTYTDLSLNLEEELTKFVWETDVYVIANQSTIYARMSGEGGLYKIFSINSKGNLLVGDEAVCKIAYGKWVSIKVICNLITEKYSVYADGKLVAQREFSSTDALVKPKYIRVGFTSGASSNSEVFLNKIRMYDGEELRDFENGNYTGTDSADIAAKNALKKTLHESKEQANELLKEDVVFFTTNGKFYASGKKLSCRDYGKDSYYENGNVMVDVKVISAALGTQCKMNGSKAEIKGKSFNTVKKGDAFFVSANEVGKALFKYVYDTDNREFILLSDKDRGYTNHVASDENTETIDLIWRYMQFDRPSGDDLLTALKLNGQERQHPRLFVKKDEVLQLRRRIEHDKNLKKILNQVITECDGYFTKPLVKGEITDGLRMFSDCEEVKKMLFNLCTVYLITGDEKYAERAWEELENACLWDNWNVTKHFLDSGEIGPGVAFAYDVLYDYLTDDQKEFVRRSVEKHYFNYCVDMYTGANNEDPLRPKYSNSNWAAVCGTSMFMLAVTFMDEEDENSLFAYKCRYIAENALRTFERLVTAVAPEGVWSEGFGYVEYVTEHMGMSLEIIDNIFNNDFNFLTANGLTKLPEYMMYMETVQGSFNKGASNGTPKLFPPEAMLYTRLTNSPEKMGLYNDFRKIIGIDTNKTQYLLFYDPEYAVKSDNVPLQLDRYFETNGTGIMRSSHTDIDSLYVAVSGGDAGHYDKGSFIMDSIGERWIVDLGRNGSHTMFFLDRADVHSALVINPSAEDKGQNKEAFAKAVKVESKMRGAQMVYDLSEVYGQWVKTYKRGFLVSDDRNTLTVRDELVLNEDCSLEWNLMTRADIEIASDKKSAVLSQNGKKLKITALCSEDGWYFEKTEDAAPTGGWVDGEKSHKAGNTPFSTEEQKAFAGKTKKLILKANGSGEVTYSVKLAPVIEGEVFSDVENISLDSWIVPDGNISPKPEASAIYADGELIEGFMSGIKEYTLSYIYGSAVPKITADAPLGKIDIIQPASFADNAKVTVTLDNGKKAEYKINLRVIERITDALIDTQPLTTLPQGVKMLPITDVYASHIPQEQHIPINVTDGDVSTRWTSNEKGAYIEVDLGAVYDLSGIAMAFVSGNKRNYIYDILVSEDKMDYKRIYQGQSSGKTSDYEFLQTPVRARYVRYVGYQHTAGDWNSLGELRPTIAQ